MVADVINEKEISTKYLYALSMKSKKSYVIKAVLQFKNYRDLVFLLIDHNFTNLVEVDPQEYEIANKKSKSIALTESDFKSVEYLLSKV
jgi:hypothetical protein